MKCWTQVLPALICLALVACGGSNGSAVTPSTAPAPAGKPSGVGAPQGVASGPLAETVASAAREGILRATWSQSTLGGAQGFQEIGDAMNKKYGLDLRYEWAPGPDMGTVAGKLMQE